MLAASAGSGSVVNHASSISTATGRARRPQADHEHVGIVPRPGAGRGRGIAAERGPYAPHLVGRDRRARSRSSRRAPRSRTCRRRPACRPRGRPRPTARSRRRGDRRARPRGPRPRRSAITASVSGVTSSDPTAMRTPGAYGPAGWSGTSIGPHVGQGGERDERHALACAPRRRACPSRTRRRRAARPCSRSRRRPRARSCDPGSCASLIGACLHVPQLEQAQQRSSWGNSSRPVDQSTALVSTGHARASRPPRSRRSRSRRTR